METNQLTTFGYVSRSGELLTPGGRPVNRRSRRGAALGGLLTVLFGVGWLATSMWMMGGTIHDSVVGLGETTGQGVVQDIRWITSTTGKSRGRTCQPVADLTVGDSRYTATTRFSTSPCAWKPDQSVTVIYNPDHIQETARIVTPGGVSAMAFIFPALGLIPLALGLRAIIQAVGGLGPYRRRSAR